MEKLTRRKLMTQTSVGAGAVGVLAITAACSPTDTTENPKGNSVNVADNPLAVFVTDPARGTLVVMKGDREIIVNNANLAQSLLALA